MGSVGASYRSNGSGSLSNSDGISSGITTVSASVRATISDGSGDNDGGGRKKTGEEAIKTPAAMKVPANGHRR